MASLKRIYLFNGVRFGLPLQPSRTYMVPKVDILNSGYQMTLKPPTITVPSLVAMTAVVLPSYLAKLPFCGEALAKVDTSILTFFISFVLSHLISSSGTSLNAELLESVAWRYFLPASVACGIICSSLKSKSSTNSRRMEDLSHTNLSHFRMIVAFIFGAIGSGLGGAIAMGTFYYASQHIPMCNTYLQAAQLTITDLFKVSAGLTASYVGGTSNLFETVHVLGLSSASKALMNLLAVTDIAVMIIYFAVLQSIQRRYSNKASLASINITNINEGNVSGDNSVRSTNHSAYTASSVLLSLGITLIGQFIQQHYLPYPGIAIFVITILSSLFATGFHRAEDKTKLGNKYLVEALSDLGSGYLNLFYASLGLQLQWSHMQRSFERQILVVLFSIVLSVHLLTLSLGTKLWNTVVKYLWRKRYVKTAKSNEESMIDNYIIDTTTMLIASNACVGGSATAVSMATSPCFQRQDLAVPACIAGILGYIVGTPLALALYKLSLRIFRP